MRKVKVYAASSWRNRFYDLSVSRLRNAGFDVYDFKADSGFQWSEIDKNWTGWTIAEYRSALSHPLAVEGFRNDFTAMVNSDSCVLVMPAGRSACMETGWFWGNRKPFWILAPDPIEPDLMFKKAVDICTTEKWLISSMENHFRANPLRS